MHRFGGYPSGGTRRLQDCAAIAEALEGCRLLFVTSTIREAEPLIAALERPQAYDVATKAVVRGTLNSEGAPQRQALMNGPSRWMPSTCPSSATSASTATCRARAGGSAETVDASSVVVPHLR